MNKMIKHKFKKNFFNRLLIRRIEKEKKAIINLFGYYIHFIVDWHLKDNLSLINKQRLFIQVFNQFI